MFSHLFFAVHGTHCSGRVGPSRYGVQDRWTGFVSRPLEQDTEKIGGNHPIAIRFHSDELTVGGSQKIDDTSNTDVSRHVRCIMLGMARDRLRITRPSGMSVSKLATIHLERQPEVLRLNQNPVAWVR